MTRPIARVGLARIDLPFKHPLPCPAPAAAPGDPPARRSILVAVEADEGLVGVGECAPPPAASTPELLDRLWRELSGTVVPALLGLTVDDPADIARAAAAWGGLHPSARAGGETALWDLVGARHRINLSGLLGASAARIEAGVTSGLDPGECPTVVDLVRAVEPHMAEGYRRLCVAIAPGRDLAFVEAVRHHFPGWPLAIDAGGRFDPDDPAHVALFRRLDELAPLWIEAPYPAGRVDALAALQAELESPICLDARDSEAIDRGACRLARLSIQAAGGLGPARDLHDRLAGRGVACRVSVGPETGVGLSQALHLATLPNCKDPGDVAPTARWLVDDVVVPPVEFDGPGLFLVPLRPGLGHLLDPLKVRAHQVESREWTA